MAKITVVVDVPGKTVEEVMAAARGIEDMPMDDPISGWDILALHWGGDLESLEMVSVVDMISDDQPTPAAPVPTVARVAGPCPCECNRGGFCGGCGHAGCGRR